jgi:hypothetical protein
MTSEQIDDERRRGRIAGIAAIVGIAIFIAAMGLAGDFNSAEQAEQLKLFDSVSSDLLIQTLLQAFALLLFLPALVSLFRAIQMRVSTFRRGLIGVVVVSPILLAISLVTAYFAYKAAADAFLKPGAYDTGSNDVANDVFYDQFPTQVRTGLGLAGSLGLAFTTVFIGLNAMRAGLMTRFWGTLAMALGIGSLLFGSVMLLAYMMQIALLNAGWWPNGRPPAWDAGEAIPWPKPGEPGAVPQEGDEVAAPQDFEGTATEVDAAADPARPARRDNRRKRKRKQRG